MTATPERLKQLADFAEQSGNKPWVAEIAAYLREQASLLRSRQAAPKVITPTFILCDAYESGIGHGLQRDGSKCPYAEKEVAEAWNIGYELGVQRSERQAAGMDAFELAAWRRANPQTRYCGARGCLVTETVINAGSAADALEQVAALDRAANEPTSGEAK